MALSEGCLLCTPLHSISQISDIEEEEFHWLVLLMLCMTLDLCFVDLPRFPDHVVAMSFVLSLYQIPAK